MKVTLLFIPKNYEVYEIQVREKINILISETYFFRLTDLRTRAIPSRKC